RDSKRLRRRDHPGPQADRQVLRSFLFLLDLVSSIPMDYIFLALNQRSNVTQLVHAGRALKILRLAKLLSLLRLLRLSRLVRYVSQWEELLNIASIFIRVVNLVCLMLLLAHWNGCLQFLDAYWFRQYTWALFKAMSHMLSIGYGQHPPTSLSEAWITIVSMMTGATCYALFVGHSPPSYRASTLPSAFIGRSSNRWKSTWPTGSCRELCASASPIIMSTAIREKMFDENDILGELSECLREQIINYNCRALVAAVPFFTYADQTSSSEVVTKLRYEVFQARRSHHQGGHQSEQRCNSFANCRSQLHLRNGASYQ
uniref:Ion_trans domain-containing protein n=1 Tax=Macrostomum lignano TaxID=282301 RepID=A0A1I8FBC3_9PLAT